MVDLAKGAVEVARSNVAGVCSSGEFIGIAETTAAVSIYRHDLGHRFLLMPSYSDTVSCCCVNQTFQIAVIGTRDGSLILNSLTKGATVRVMSLDGARPYQIAITNGWGFIAVYARRVLNGKLEHFIFVFNVNGALLRRRVIDFEVAIWSTWTNSKGFDWIVLADENGKLFVFEVFNADIGDGIFRCRSPITFLTYALDIGCVIAVTKDARVIFVPNESLALTAIRSLNATFL
jgi:hypothetical protein